MVQETKRFWHKIVNVFVTLDEVKADEKSADPKKMTAPKRKGNPNAGRKTKEHELPDDFMQKVDNLIMEMIDKPGFCVDTMVERLGVNKQILRRKICRERGMNPLAYINNVKMEYARNIILEHPEYPLTRVGEMCGYSIATHFTRTFKKSMGVLPKDIRKEAKQKDTK